MTWEAPNDGGSLITSYSIYIYNNNEKDEHAQEVNDDICTSELGSAQEPITDTECNLSIDNLLRLEPFLVNNLDEITVSIKAYNADGQ